MYSSVKKTFVVLEVDVLYLTWLSCFKIFVSIISPISRPPFSSGSWTSVGETLAERWQGKTWQRTVHVVIPIIKVCLDDKSIGIQYMTVRWVFHYQLSSAFSMKFKATAPFSQLLLLFYLKCARLKNSQFLSCVRAWSIPLQTSPPSASKTSKRNNLRKHFVIFSTKFDINRSKNQVVILLASNELLRVRGVTSCRNFSLVMQHVFCRLHPSAIPSDFW